MARHDSTGGSRVRWSGAAWLLAAIFAADELQAQQPTPPGSGRSPGDVRLEFARVNLGLAQTELQIAEQFNRRLADVLPATSAEERSRLLRVQQIPDFVLERLKSNVRLAQEQLQQAQSPSTGDTEKIRRQFAEERVRLARVNLDSLRSERAAGMPINELELQRLEYKLKLAELQVELLSQPENLLTIVDSLQRQIDRLHEQLLAQEQRLAALEGR